MRRLERGNKSFLPTRPRQHPRNDVGEVEKRRRQEDFFHALVGALYHQQPHHYGGNRHTHVAGNVEQLQTAGDSGELRNHVAEVGDDQPQHHEERNPQAIFFADEIAEPFTGGRAHARRHLLHHDQRDRHGDHDPEQKVAELCSSGGVGIDTAGVIVHVGGDEPRTNDGQEHQQADSPDSKPSLIGHDTGSYGQMIKTSQNTVASGQSSVVSRQLASGQSSVASCQLPVASCQLPVASVEQSFIAVILSTASVRPWRTLAESKDPRFTGSVTPSKTNADPSASHPPAPQQKRVGTSLRVFRSG